MIDKNTGKYNKKIFIIFTILLFILCLLFPYSGDDWGWGSFLGIEKLVTFFDNYNGRYVGNLIVLLLTRDRILRSIVTTSVIMGIAILCKKLVNKNRSDIFLIALLLLLIIPRAILRQSIVWTSGFTNYAIPTFLILLMYYIWEKYDDKKITKYISFIFGLLTSLFVEHITIFCILSSLVIFIYKFIKKKEINLNCLFYLIASILGCALMFSNEAYHTIIVNEDSYREIPSGIYGFLKRFVINIPLILEDIVYNNVIMITLLSALILYVLYKSNKKYNLYNKFSYLITIIFPLYLWVLTINPGFALRCIDDNTFNLIFTIIYFINLFITCLLFIEDEKIKNHIMYYLLSIVVLIAPLFFVSPIGSRCFFPMYIFFILIIINLINYLFKTEKEVINNLLNVFVIFAFSYLLFVYANIFSVEIERVKYLNEQRDNKNAIYIIDFPYEDYVWHGNRKDATYWDLKFRAYYNINERVSLKRISLNDYKLYSDFLNNRKFDK